MVPGVSAPQDVLKVFFESQFRVKSDSYKLHLRIEFEPLAIKF